MNHPTKYWLLVASKDHVQIGVQGGFCQANHGKANNLKRMKQGDGLVFYSSKEHYGDKTPCQKFTAIGQVRDEELYQGIMAGGFEPYRRNISFEKSEEAAIQPLIEDLSFIKDKKHWGYPFRFGFFEIPEADFKRIEREMIPSVVK